MGVCYNLRTLKNTADTGSSRSGDKFVSPSASSQIGRFLFEGVGICGDHYGGAPTGSHHTQLEEQCSCGETEAGSESEFFLRL